MKEAAFADFVSNIAHLERRDAKMMENIVEEYKKQFKPETLELIVRIRWCWEKGNSDFAMLGDCYIADASIYRVFDVKSGEMIDDGMNEFYRMEWLAPKKLFGFKYGYKFKKGYLYRVLVREYISEEDEKCRRYYLEQVLEENVKVPTLDPIRIFESKFEEKETDLTVLIQRGINGWAIMDVNYRVPKAVFIASIDHNTNELSQSYGVLTWMEKESKSKIKFNFDDLEKYHVRVRKSKENDNSYLLLNVIKKMKDDRLERLKEEYIKPVVIRNEFGEFELDKDLNWFEGKIGYLGDTCIVRFSVEQGEAIAEKQLNRLGAITKDLADWDEKVKKYATQELFDLVNDWCEEEREITEEEFWQRIRVMEINIDPDGAVEVELDNDEMFTDHSIVIDIDEDGNFVSADIVG